MADYADPARKLARQTAAAQPAGPSALLRYSPPVLADAVNLKDWLLGEPEATSMLATISIPVVTRIDVGFSKRVQSESEDATRRSCGIRDWQTDVVRAPNGGVQLTQGEGFTHGCHRPRKQSNARTEPHPVAPR